MSIIGIRNGMVMQRNKDNVCEVYFAIPQKPKVLIVSPKCNATIEPNGDRFCLKGIPVGGPYKIKIDNEEFTQMYVGDLWLLIGQSNMQGVGRIVDTKYNANPKIRAFYMNDEWDTANHPLHERLKSVHKVHYDEKGLETIPFNLKGVGPGLSFAQRMYDLTHIPQGVIACAHGGTNLHTQWSPSLKDEGENSLYGATYDRFINNGSNIRGAFWYQGESDAHEEVAEMYEKNMIDFVESLRKDFKANLPFVQVQISRSSWANYEDLQLNIDWNTVRETQRTLHQKIDNFDTVHTIAYSLSDGIHLDAKSQEIVGKDAADAMYCLINGPFYDAKPGIKLRKMRMHQDDFDSNMSYLTITYDNVNGKLSGGFRAMGFSLSSNSEKPDSSSICDITCNGNEVTLRIDCSYQDLKSKYLWYGFGRNPSCNIIDSNCRSIPAFGPIKIADKTFK